MSVVAKYTVQRYKKVWNGKGFLPQYFYRFATVMARKVIFVAKFVYAPQQKKVKR
jgi:hypothetical protein